MIALRNLKNMKFTLSYFFMLSFEIIHNYKKWANGKSYYDEITIFRLYLADLLEIVRVKNELLYEYYFDYILAAKTTQIERL